MEPSLAITWLPSWCQQLKSQLELYEKYVPMSYNDYLEKMSKYFGILSF